MVKTLALDPTALEARNLELRHVTWMPSYSPEMRGGTAYCSVVVSGQPVGSPITTRGASCAIIMNLPSLLKFESAVVAGGRIFVNSSLINRQVRRGASSARSQRQGPACGCRGDDRRRESYPCRGLIGGRTEGFLRNSQCRRAA